LHRLPLFPYTTLFRSVSFVFFAGNAHEESQPVHLLVADTGVCASRCAREFGNPCERFCPAGVYEMVDDGAGGRRLQINAANCVRSEEHTSELQSRENL